MTSLKPTSMLRSTWCLALLGVACNFGMVQPGHCEPIWTGGGTKEPTNMRIVAPPAERLDPHTEYALQATVAAYTLIHDELPTRVEQLQPMLMFNNEFTQLNLDDLIKRRYTDSNLDLSIRALALLDAEPFLGACTTFHRNVPSPEDPEFLLALQVGLLTDAMKTHRQRHADAPRNLDDLAASWDGYNVSGWINPYTGEPMVRVETSVARTHKHAGDYAESIREDHLRILLYRMDQHGVSQPIMIHFGDLGNQFPNPVLSVVPMVVVSEAMPEWKLGEDFY